MAGYSARQSTFTTGDTITAAHSNNEFNAILAAFHVSTGHKHDGSTAGDGGPISTLFSNAISVGTGADTDIALTFNANTNDGVITWMEDQDYFQFSDDILISTTEKLQFRDTAIYINSSADGQLDLVADTEIQIAATTVDINGNVDISGSLTLGGTTITSTGAELNILDGVTSTAAELNILDGVTSTAAELNILDGVTSTAAELNILDGVTSTAAELNILDGVTSTATELNILDGVTSTATELNVVDGGTSASGTTVADGDRVVYNDAGTMKQVAVTDLDTYFSATSKALTNKTLTSPVLNTGVSGTAVLDEDNMASNSATQLATQQSIKAYVDATVTAEDLDVTSDSGTIAIDLDSETLTIAGGTGLASSATSNTVTLAIDSTVATLTGSQTLTNKTLTSPVLNTGVSGTAVLDEDNLASDSATKLATQQSIKAYVDGQVGGVSTTWTLEDDDGTEVGVASGQEVKFIGSGITTNWTDTDNGTDADPYDMTFTVDAAQTGITSILAADLKIGEDNETKIDFETANEIHFYANNTEQVYLADNIFGPQADSDVDLGTTGVRWKDAFIDTITTTGALTVGGDLVVNGTTTTVNSTTVTIDDPVFTLGGDSAPGSDDNKDRGIEFRYHTGSAAKIGFFGFDDNQSAFTFIPDATNSSEVFSGSVGNAIFNNVTGTLQTAAQTNITSVGALDGGSITSGFGTIDTGSSNITTTGLISGGSLDIDNVLINGTTIGHTDDTDLMTLSNGGLVVAGTLQATGDITGTLATAAQTNITSVGALGGGSITSGFGNIDTGSSTITTTGLISGGSLDIDNVLINGTTIGHTDDTDLLTLANGALTVAGTIEATGTITGTLATAAQTNITSTGALDGGSITAGFGAIDNGTSGIRTNTFTAETSMVPDASGGADLGSTSLEWGDLYIADDKKIYLGSDQNFSIEYDEDGNDTTAVVAAGGVSLAPHGTSTGNGTELRFQELAANGANYVGFKSPDAIAANKVFVLPNADGSSGQFLKTDGSTNLSWGSASPSITKVADGAITNGKPVVITSTGKVAQIAGVRAVSEASSTNNRLSTKNEFITGRGHLAYSASANRFIAIHQVSTSNNNAQARVVSISSTAQVSLGSASEHLANAGAQNGYCSADIGDNKIIIGYASASGGYKAKVFTINATNSTFTVGSEVNVWGDSETGSTGTEAPEFAYDSSSGKILFLGGYGGDSSKPYLNIMTVSGSTITVGTKQKLHSTDIGHNGTSTTFGLAKTADGQFIAKTRHQTQSTSGNRHWYFRPFDVSGTTITIGQVLNTSSTLGSVGSGGNLVYSGVPNTAVTFQQGAQGAGPGLYPVTRSGTGSTATVALGSRVAVDGQSADFGGGYLAKDGDGGAKIHMFYDNSSSFRYLQATVATDGALSIITGSPYGGFGGIDIDDTTSLPEGTAKLRFRMATGNIGGFLFEDSGDQNRIALKAYVPPVVGSTNLGAANYIGIASSTVSDGANANIAVVGAVDDAQSSLTPAQTLYVQVTGELASTADSPSVVAGVALSSTEILIKG